MSDAIKFWIAKELVGLGLAVAFVVVCVLAYLGTVLWDRQTDRRKP